MRLLTASILVLTTVAVLGCLGYSAAAQDHPKAFVCNFEARHSATLEAGSQNSSAPRDKLSFTFAAIDLKTNTAQIIGNAGAANVTVLAPIGQIQFLEITNSGNISLTSVFHIASADGRVPAVHSRHMKMGTVAAVVSQYVGTCLPRF